MSTDDTAFNVQSPADAADWTPAISSAPPTALSEAVDHILHHTTEVARDLVGAHQSAATLIVANDWEHARKWFSLSEKYAGWFSYRAPARGVGLHAEVVHDNAPMRLTQPEVESHPAWRGFGDESPRHPPMRGWLAIPLIGQDGRNYGLLQLSDKYDGADFTEEDERRLTHLARLTAVALTAVRELHGDDRLGAPR